ncbi:MAG: RidA family protein [Candidatus Cloacimonetes bacterium]|nr:RidA family protein [Candidatus Cloacimonadota bacterium]
MKTIVQTKDAPEAIGPYSQAVIFEKYVYTSGQIPLTPAGVSVAEGDVKIQTKQCLENLEAVLLAAGSSLDHILKTTCYLSNMEHFAEFNEVYAEYITSNPARACVAVRELPRGVMVEIEAIAVRPSVEEL